MGTTVGMPCLSEEEHHPRRPDDGTSQREIPGRIEKRSSIDKKTKTSGSVILILILILHHFLLDFLLRFLLDSLAYLL
jgi:hypothetical protein